MMLALSRVYARYSTKLVCLIFLFWGSLAEGHSSFSVDDITHTLTAMSYVKLNMFHWHIVDSQSFSLVVPGFEDLSTAAAYSPTSVYSASDVEWIVAFAAAVSFRNLTSMSQNEQSVAWN